MLNVTITSQEKQFFSGEATRVVVPGVKSRFEILNNHCPIMSLLTSGSIVIHIPQSTPLALWIDGGIIQVEDNVVSILTDSAHQARLAEEEKLRNEQQEIRKQLSTHKTANYNALLKNLEQLTSELNAIKEIQHYRKKN